MLFSERADRKTVRVCRLRDSRSSYALFDWDRDWLRSAECTLWQRETAHSGARMERIESLRIAIATGRYHVSAADVAQKLMGYILANNPA